MSCCLAHGQRASAAVVPRAPGGRWAAVLPLLLQVVALVAVVTVTTASSPGLAGQASADLLVRVNLVPAPSTAERVFCTSSTGPRGFGATVTLVCATGAVVSVEEVDSAGRPILHGGARRYWLQPADGRPALGWLDAVTTAGTVTGWQIVRQSGRDYVELTWGW